jgi:hypothetical protein
MIKLEKKLPAPKGQDIIKAEAGLTGVRRAAIAAGHRMAALEREAENIHVKTMLARTARVTSTPKHGVPPTIACREGAHRPMRRRPCPSTPRHLD